MSVVGMFRTHLTTQVGSDGQVDEQNPDDQIKFFETSNLVILTAWFVDLQNTSDKII